MEFVLVQKTEKKLLGGCYVMDETGSIISFHKRNCGKIISKRVDRAGYYTVRLSSLGVTRTFYLHRLMADAFIPNPENKPLVNHMNGNKLDNRICNLEWVTHSQNILHGYKMGFCKIKEDCQKRVIDISDGRIFKNVMQAAREKGIAYSTCKNYLNERRKNKTSLKLII